MIYEITLNLWSQKNIIQQLSVSFNFKESNGNHFLTDAKNSGRDKSLEVKKAPETSISQAVSFSKLNYECQSLKKDIHHIYAQLII